MWNVSSKGQFPTQMWFLTEFCLEFESSSQIVKKRYFLDKNVFHQPTMLLDTKIVNSQFHRTSFDILAMFTKFIGLHYNETGLWSWVNTKFQYQFNTSEWASNMEDGNCTQLKSDDLFHAVDCTEKKSITPWCQYPPGRLHCWLNIDINFMADKIIQYWIL